MSSCLQNNVGATGCWPLATGKKLRALSYELREKIQVYIRWSSCSKYSSNNQRKPEASSSKLAANLQVRSSLSEFVLAE